MLLYDCFHLLAGLNTSLSTTGTLSGCFSQVVTFLLKPLGYCWWNNRFLKAELPSSNNQLDNFTSQSIDSVSEGEF
jgi:hypothetical protein